MEQGNGWRLRWRVQWPPLGQRGWPGQSLGTGPQDGTRRLSAQLRGAVAVVAGALPGNCPAAQRGHRQDWRRWASGMAASASGAISAPMHQQLSGARPAVMAHWLLWPHRGQRSGSTLVEAAEEGAENAMLCSVGRPAMARVRGGMACGCQHRRSSCGPPKQILASPLAAGVMCWHGVAACPFQPPWGGTRKFSVMCFSARRSASRTRTPAVQAQCCRQPTMWRRVSGGATTGSGRGRQTTVVGGGSWGMDAMFHSALPSVKLNSMKYCCRNSDA